MTYSVLSILKSKGYTEGQGVGHYWVSSDHYEDLTYVGLTESLRLCIEDSHWGVHVRLEVLNPLDPSRWLSEHTTPQGDIEAFMWITHYLQHPVVTGIDMPLVDYCDNIKEVHKVYLTADQAKEFGIV